MIFLLLLTLAADPLPGILAQMDANSAAFKSAKADFRQVNHNAAVDKDTEANGTMALKRAAPRDIRTLITLTDPATHQLVQQVAVGKGVARNYYPKIKTIQEYPLSGKNQSIFDQFYLLAFGGSGKDLAANYDVTYIGPDTVGNAKTSHLQLIPKNADTLKHYTKIELWLTDPKAVAAQLKLTTPARDTTTFIYTDVKLNPKIADSDLELKKEKGVRIEHPAQ